jgi:hypothetical protein
LGTANEEALSFCSLDSASSQLVFSLLISLRFASSMEAFFLENPVIKRIGKTNVLNSVHSEELGCRFLLEKKKKKNNI